MFSCVLLSLQGVAMGIWVTSDLHLGHEKVATIRGFDSAEIMGEVIKENWNSRVMNEDEVWVLGDLALGKWEDALDELGTWKGSKHLIVGNHDRCSPVARNWQSYVRAYLKVFETVTTMGVLRFNGTRWLMSHYPYAGDRGVDRHTQFRLPDLGHPLLHGHTHSTSKVTITDKKTKQINVAVDAWRMAPVSMGEIDKLLRSPV